MRMFVCCAAYDHCMHVDMLSGCWWHAARMAGLFHSQCGRVACMDMQHLHVCRRHAGTQQFVAMQAGACNLDVSQSPGWSGEHCFHGCLILQWCRSMCALKPWVTSPLSETCTHPHLSGLQALPRALGCPHCLRQVPGYGQGMYFPAYGPACLRLAALTKRQRKMQYSFMYLFSAKAANAQDAEIMCAQVGFEKATKLYDIAHKDKDAHAVDFVTNCMRQKVCCMSSVPFVLSLAHACTTGLLRCSTIGSP